MLGDEVGEILYSLPNNLNWRIPRLSCLPSQSDSRIWSPMFGSQTIPMKFDDVAPGWHFYLMTNTGRQMRKRIQDDRTTNEKWIKLSITFENEDVEPIDWVRVGVVDETRRVINICHCIWSYTHGGFSDINLVKESKLKLRQCGAIPNGYLRLFCETPSKNCIPISDAETDAGENASNSVATTSSASTSVSSSTDGWDCKVCLIKNNISDTKCIACETPKSKRIKNTATTSHADSNSEIICDESSVSSWKCKDCLKNNSESESICIACGALKPAVEKNTGLDKLSENFKYVLKEKIDTDLAIKVQGQEFNVHRLILRARSPVFDDMLSKNLRKNKTRGRKKKTTKNQPEKNENVIEIEDCEPGIFEEFLLFVYSGKIENMTCENAYGLYDAADKYNLPDLKRECIDFLKEKVSSKNVCEIIRMASKHNELELLKLATNYFAMHMDKILTTDSWMMFLKDNHVAANELCIEALKLGFKKKDAFI